MHLEINPADLQPLIRQVVTEALAQLDADRARLDGKLAYSESEAAQLIGLEPWQLRDERRRGNIRASQIVGRRIRYLREDLVSYLLGRRWTKAGNAKRRPARAASRNVDHPVAKLKDR